MSDPYARVQYGTACNFYLQKQCVCAWWCRGVEDNRYVRVPF